LRGEEKPRCQTRTCTTCRPGKGGWGVERRGAQRASGRFDTKEEAVRRGRELAKGQKGRLVIRKQDGTIQEERTYRKDPHPPEG
jgi:uncharacterized protein YdaT